MGIYSQTSSLAQLRGAEDFLYRHIGPTEAQQQTMLAYLGISDLDEMVKQAIPPDVLDTSPAALEEPIDESEALHSLALIAKENKRCVSMFGCGYHPTNMPAVIQRNVLENPGWYTAYTPYQAEISQGRLELLLNFQQMICELTGFTIANSSLLDEATAAAEAITMAHSMTKSRSNTLYVHSELHPQTLALLQTRCQPLGIEIITFHEHLPEGDAFALIVQYPSTFGDIGNPGELVDLAKQRAIVPIAIVDPLAMMLLESPASLGFAIAVGCTQRFGTQMGYGGPHAGFLACEEKYKRVMPGRIIGVSKDSKGKLAMRMALQTREQHIRREKATSNICTAQVLLANLSVLYAMHHGQQGMQRIALRVHRMARVMATIIVEHGYKLVHKNYFDCVGFDAGNKAPELAEKALNAGYLVRHHQSCIYICLNETVKAEHLVELGTLLFGEQPDITALEKEITSVIPEAVQRKELPLNHDIFSGYCNETAMMRYLHKLQDRDITLTHSMIPLGSCTMKLNAASELMPISWPELADIHPFAPRHTTRGYSRLIADVERMLCSLTGFAQVSVQPNSGAQGEYAGLLAIRRYHLSRGDTHRNVCLIPASAHGTNPASAVMAGMKVIVVQCDKHGNVDKKDLLQKAEENRDNLAALMITYPSTHGVFESSFTTICEMVHECGGKVYMDGANTNALAGLVRPSDIGVDVMHFNLHKTFCIPHGGGGPGVGPIGVVESLAPYLPGHPALSSDDPVAAAPYGSALILAITWMYIRMMGSNGLALASKISILNANYIARRLGDHFPLLYKGKTGMVAHECIIDLRPLKEQCGIDVEDVAKRLMDYGFHSPTMSFPVAGTLMIEPTESESLEEIERFCQAMIAVREEISKVEKGEWTLEDNPLVNAPHTMADISEDWQHCYTPKEAFFPLAYIAEHKFWPSVNRIDNVYGDRNLLCNCVGIEAFQG